MSVSNNGISYAYFVQKLSLNFLVLRVVLSVFACCAYIQPGNPISLNGADYFPAPGAYNTPAFGRSEAWTENVRSRADERSVENQRVGLLCRPKTSKVYCCVFPTTVKQRTSLIANIL